MDAEKVNERLSKTSLSEAEKMSVRIKIITNVTDPATWASLTDTDLSHCLRALILPTDQAKPSSATSTNQASDDEASGTAADLFSVYRDTKNGLEDVLELIFNEPHLHRHYAIFTQSSGYGKTRLLMHLLRNRYPGVLLLCGDVNGGFRMNSEIKTLTRDYAQQTDDAERTIVVTKFLRRMCLYIQTYHTDLGLLFANQFDEEAGRYRSTFMDPLEAFCKVSPAQRASADVARAADSDSGKRHVAFDPTCMAQPEEMPMERWIIGFDEAQCLSDGLLSRLKAVLDQFGIVGVFMSTCGHIAQLLPKSISTRKTERAVVPPVHVLRTFDLNTGANRLHLGRPLWKEQWHTRCFGDYRLLLYYAAARLCSIDAVTSIADAQRHRQSTLLSLFMVRFGGIRPVDSVAGSTFVTHHLATYTKLGIEAAGGVRNITTEVTYPSEPILAEASAFCTSALAMHWKRTPYFPRTEVIEAVVAGVRSATLVQLDKGDLGEMMASALIGYQLDIIRENALARPDMYDPGLIEHSMAAPVSVADLLLSLYTGAQDCVRDLPELAEYTLNANHFIRLQHSCAYSTCVEAITRGAAIITYDCSPGLDFFIEAIRPWADAAEEVTTDDLGSLAINDPTPPEPGLTPLPNTFRGFPLFSTARQATVYFEGGRKKYLTGRPVDGATVAVEPPAPRSPPGAPLHHNIHVRFSVKNYSNDISAAAADTMLDNLNPACEPVNAVAGGGKETILVNILINMGSGLLAPSLSVATPRVTRSGDASYSKAVRLAVGLNHGDLSDGHRCFKGFPAELLQAFRSVTGDRKAEGPQSEDYWAMRYGGDLYRDMSKCADASK